MDDRLLQRVRDLFTRSNVPWDRVAFAAVTGSRAYGLSTGTGDTDATVVWTESYRDLVTRAAGKGALHLRTQPDGVRSGPGDIDLQVYTVRHFVHLAAGGNPSILAALFTPTTGLLAGERFPFADVIALTRSKKAGAAFLGYLDSQLSRWRDGRIRGRVHRPELVEQYGYDVKFASQAIRLGIQGIEYLTTGTITLPIPEPDRTRLLAVRTGQVPEPDALAWAGQVRDGLRDALDRSPLPHHPDQAALDDWLVAWHRSHETTAADKCMHPNARPVRTLVGGKMYTNAWCPDCAVGDR